MMKRIIIYTAMGVCCAFQVSANILVNGGFDQPISFYEEKYVDPDGMTGGQSNPIDQGWVSYAATSNMVWKTENGVGTRDVMNKSGSFGVAQIVTNPNNGSFDNSDTVTISFDYAISGILPKGFNYRLFGITGDSSVWAGSKGIALTLPGDDKVPGVANDHTYYQLDHIAPILVATNGTYSMDVALTNQYDFFAIVFWTDRKNNTSVTIDNVVLDPVGGAQPTLNIISLDVQDDVNGLISSVVFGGDATPPYVLQTKSVLDDANWTDVATGTASPLVYTNASGSAASFFRVKAQ